MEVATKYGHAWIENTLKSVNADANPPLFRVAFKLATGSGKTLVMAMLIAIAVGTRSGMLRGRGPRVPRPSAMRRRRGRTRRSGDGWPGCSVARACA
jgi:hypothetical protein